MDEAHILEDLLGVESPSGREATACLVFAEHARQLGFRVRFDRTGNALATMGSGTPHTMFLGHIDTVPGTWPVRMEDGILHGRGAVDAKGALVAGLVAAARVGPMTAGTRTVVAAVGEECDSRGALELLRNPAPDALIVGEPSGWNRVAIGFRGRRTGIFRATSPVSHVSSPEPGSLDRAVDVASGLRASLKAAGGTGLFASASARIFRWMHEARPFDEGTEFEIDLRTPVGFDHDLLVRAAPEIEWASPLDAVLVNKNNGVVRSLVAGIRTMGGQPEYLCKAGTSDMNHAASRWAIPMASYGPGDPTLDHSREERISLSELSRSVAVLHDAFLRLNVLGASPRVQVC